MDFILYLLHLIKHQHKQICWLLNFICRFTSLRPVQHRNGKSIQEDVVCPVFCARRKKA